MQSRRAICAPLAVLLLAGGCIAAEAQTTPATPDTASNPAVVAEPAAAGNGAPPVPGGESGATRPLLQPGEPLSANEPIHLHLPAKHPPPRHVARRKSAHAPAEVATTNDSAPPTTGDATTTTSTTPADATGITLVQKPQPTQTPRRAPARAAAAKPQNRSRTAPAPGAVATAVPFSFQTSPLAASAEAPAAAPTQQTPAQPAPAAEDTALAHGLSKQSQILFAPGVADPAAGALDAIRGLAGPLNVALAAGTSRIQVVGYGGNRGDRSSQARRLSLKRALIIRQLLIDGGVPANRIDVRAMGGANDGASADRVDVFTKA